MITLSSIFLFGMGNVAAASNAIYVNNTSGNDSWNGLNSTWINGLNGPKASIKNATESVNSGGYVYIANGIYNENNISINTNMTIIGGSSNYTVINGNMGSVFNIALGVNVTICNVTFINESSDNGGAIINQGYLTVNNSIFTNNTASSNGGSIYNDNRGYLTLINDNFTSNNAADFGGAIYNDGILNINDCNLTNNVGAMGGAIYNYGTLNTFNSNLDYNSACDGGAIVNEGNLVESYCNFTDNNAMCAGGATIIFNDCNQEVMNCNFTGNSATFGGVFVNYGNIEATSSNFSNNTAMDWGGVIFNYNAVKINFSSLIGNNANMGNDLYNSIGVLDASLNWWGTNNGPLDNNYDTTAPSWLVLTLTSNQYIISNNSHSTITADLWHDSDGNFHDPTIGFVPGIMVVFNTTMGTIDNQVLTIDGCAVSNFISGSTGGTAMISAFLNNQTVIIPITIDNIPPTARSNIGNGVYNVNKLVTLSMSEKGDIYYTLDGTTPTITSIKYTGPITINSSKILKYLAIDQAGNKSPIYTQTYIINKVPPKVSKTTPVNNSIKISLNSPITIKFTENIVSGINYSKIYVKDLTTNKSTYITKTISGNALIIKQINSRTRNNTYEVIIPSSAIKDKAGNNLKSVYIFKFRT
ncbi:MAG: chitobiase/beta-hexosaminidase C-terminal domain-containing protein [Methanobacterium sp.]|uniref:chitobiase/beta-hexosaminidase C-terminal domain-containing protein n=1 Tax=Methanobacterium sp. TaxID=2164 RepID=UPI003C721812